MGKGLDLGRSYFLVAPSHHSKSLITSSPRVQFSKRKAVISYRVPLNPETDFKLQ